MSERVRATGRDATATPAQAHGVRLERHGDASVMEWREVEVTPPDAGSVLVRVEWAGVNFIDVYKRTGLYKIPIPGGLGEEGAGEVVAVGADVSDVHVGDRVAWTGALGSYAEYVSVAAEKLVPVPAEVPTRVAAAIMLQGMTAHYLAVSTYPLEPGSRCLVHAAAGGVGLLLVQIAKRRGATVIATAGSDDKAALAREAGADHTIVYTREDFVVETKRVTDGAGVHVVYDSVGASTFLRGFDVLARRGTMVLFGQSSGPVAPLDPQLLNGKGSLFLTRPTLGHYTATAAETRARTDDLFAWIARDELRVRIGAEFGVQDVAAAHAALEGRATTGKVLLKVR